MASQYLCNKGGNVWDVGHKIFGFFIVSGIRAAPFHSEYTLSLRKRQEKLVVRIPYATRFKTEEEQRSFDEKIHQWIRIGMHPHVEACFGLVPGDASAYFLERIKGSTLTSWVRSGQSSLRSILSLLMQICHGVEYLHAHGIAHQELLPDSIIITGSSLVKIKEVVRPDLFGNKQDQHADIKSLGGLLRMMLFSGFVPYQADNTISAAVLPDHLQSYTNFLAPVLERCAAPAGRGYADVSSLRSDLNRVYRLVYGLDCPYHTLETDLRAESLNNQAVVCFATRRYREGLVKLQQALILYDRLPEAVYNLILYKLRSGLFPPERILLMIDTAMEDSSIADQLALLKAQVSKILGEKHEKMVPLPSFQLSSSPQSLALYRQARKRMEKCREIQHHLHNLRYEACLKSLLSAWREQRFAKDAFLAGIHDRLLSKSDKREVVGVQRYATLQGFGSSVEHLAYLPGTRKIVEAGGDDHIRIRNYGRGSKLSTIDTGGQAVTGLAVSPDGKFIAAGTADGEVVFWQSSAGNSLLWRSRLHHGRVNALAFSRDGRFFASGGADGAMVIRTIATGREKIVTAWDNRQIACLSFVADGLDLVTASDVGEIKIWAARGKKCLHQLTAHNGCIDSLSVAQQGDFFASAGGEEIKLWDIHTGQCLQQMPGHSGGRTRVLLLDDQRHLVSAGMDDMIRIRDLVSGEVVAMLDGRGNGIRSLARGSQPHFFFAGQLGGTLLIWKIIYQLNFT
ncbi:MAG: protein kinase [Proteobacteria bacterium]|nr:protein kinase [Pseudomonadota bacterium]